MLAAVRAGHFAGKSASSDEQPVNNVAMLSVGSPSHADVLREASHYLSAIKVCGYDEKGYYRVLNGAYHILESNKTSSWSWRMIFFKYFYILNYHEI